MPGSRTGAASRWLLAAVALCLLLQAWLAARLEINWDEFFFLSHSYDYQRGEMRKALQSIYVHLLGWITSLPGNEIDQIIYGRFVMLACLAGTCGLIYTLAHTFFTATASAMAVLAFAAAGPTLIHGSSFRADPISALLMMLSLVILARARMSFWTALLAGACAGLAAMITIKVVLYAPAFLGVALWRLRDREGRSEALKWLAGAALATVATFALLYVIQLMLVAQASNSATQAALGNSARTTLIEAGFLPRLAHLKVAVSTAPVQTVLMIAGAVGVLLGLFTNSSRGRVRLVAVALCGATLTCLLYYRNAYPYFYPFIFPPAMLLVAWVVDWSALLKRPLPLALLGTVLVASALYVTKTWSDREVPPQRALIDGVHAIFPEPVTMIDGSHMVGSYPKRGFFMSTWGFANYRRGKPIFGDILRRDTVPLLLLNNAQLAEAAGVPDHIPLPPERRLFDEDRAILRDNYIEHWGLVWVAGKRLTGSEAKFTILIPGTYTLEGEEAVIDGRPVAAGATVRLDRGAHLIVADAPGQRLLRWGDRLRRPASPPPHGPLFRGF